MGRRFTQMRLLKKTRGYSEAEKEILLGYLRDAVKSVAKTRRSAELEYLAANNMVEPTASERNKADRGFVAKVGKDGRRICHDFPREVYQGIRLPPIPPRIARLLDKFNTHHADVELQGVFPFRDADEEKDFDTVTGK